MDILVVRPGADGQRELVPVRWGFVPHWKRPETTAAPGRLPPINARSETAPSSPMFRDAFRLRRCLAPADAFYEWQAADASGPAAKRGKTPMLIRPRDGGLLAMAAIWDPSAGGPTAAILTRPSRGAAVGVHERMPVILPEAAWGAWLDPQGRDPAALLDDRDGEPALEVQAVSRRVNNPAFDDAACLDAADGADAGQGPTPGGLFTPEP